MVKCIFFKKGARKQCYILFLQQKGQEAKLPPSPVSSRFNTCLEAIIYHNDHLDTYEEFFTGEAQKSDAAALRFVTNCLTDKEQYCKLRIQAAFIAATAPKIMATLTALEGTGLACKVMNLLESLESYLCLRRSGIMTGSTLMEKTWSLSGSSTLGM